MTVGTTSTCWANFVEYCNILHRETKHVMSFILAELGVDGTLDSKNQFNLKGKYQIVKFENLLKKYISICYSLSILVYSHVCGLSQL